MNTFVFVCLLAGSFLLASASAFAPATTSTKKRLALSMSEFVDPQMSKPNPAIKIASTGMSLLKPIFVLEANLQAAILGAITKIDKDAVAAEIQSLKASNKVLIYTYGLSPFSAEALSILSASGYEYTNIELGKEWFLLGGEGSETRVALSKEVKGGATSLPKIFIGGECIGGFSELANLVENGELDQKMKEAKVKKEGSPDKTNFFTSLFS